MKTTYCSMKAEWKVMIPFGTLFGIHSDECTSISQAQNQTLTEVIHTC
jgi:hypothetical protein